MSETPPPFRLVGDVYDFERPDGYRPGNCWVCRRDALVCIGVTLQAPGDPESTHHPICDDCITTARTPRRRAALRAALDAKRSA
ncbi:hypothetical protein [Kitasatospora sp. NPDC057198]|uniref:hypothetical protein n=1 Tax=Kitasatospora sp. NPDC057198 TaxID=3346046 RepID=UPI00362D5470